MLCVNCGRGAAFRAGYRGAVRLRATGRPDEPFVMICECCGVDIAADGTALTSPVASGPAGSQPPASTPMRGAGGA